ncbi:hypothetical protein CVT26_005344 [Gymnopilus dilepis]|uniref:Uncharacterized protein n=1 Tax=Gymnopilus dilepis TaxID=231916 RepID=A0A409YT21_9AGAR|nr:hypothetical protein CVT26_005344 [Gymnopilus dilepis]
MVKFATYLLAAIVLAVPALSLPLADVDLSLQSREIAAEDKAYLLARQSLKDELCAELKGAPPLAKILLVKPSIYSSYTAL